MMEPVTTSIIGLVGVALGAVIGWAGEWWRARHSRAERAYYLAVQVTLALDDFVEECFQTVLIGSSERVQEHQSFSLPEPPSFPADVDWKSIDKELMREILILPKMSMRRENYIRSLKRTAYDSDYRQKAYEATKPGYAKLGLKALEISEQLREKYDFPERENNFEPDLGRRPIFEDAIATFEKKWAREKAESQEGRAVTLTTRTTRKKGARGKDD